MRLATTEGLISNVALCMICFCHNFFVAESSHQQYSYQSYDYHRREERQLETETEDDFDETDRMIMVVVFLTFAFFIFLFGSFVGYISVLDDRILGRYKCEGEVVIAQVHSVEVARGRNGHGRSTNHLHRCASDSDENVADAQIEYIATVFYTQTLSENYDVRIRKQVRAMECDFFASDISVTPKGSPKGSPRKDSTNTSLDETSVDPENLIEGCHDHQHQIIENEISFLKKCHLESSKLNLLVLPGKPKSGYPKEQAERAHSIRYRLSTVCLVISNLLLSLFCIKLAIHLISELQDERKALIAWTILTSFILSIVIQIPVIHIVLNKILVGTLEEEYFESGDFTPMEYCDDSTISMSVFSASTSDINLD